MPQPSNHELAATVSSKGQIVIPGEIRRRLNLVQGSVVRFVIDDNGIRLLPASDDIRRLKGRLHPPGGKPVSVGRMNTAIEKRRRAAGAGSVE